MEGGRQKIDIAKMPIGAGLVSIFAYCSLRLLFFSLYLYCTENRARSALDFIPNSAVKEKEK